ncbi:cupin family protein [Clathrospora elynae]|uniref:Cupin family protein n=1 Tax=Clathrospora elynae TaxID=706981 RepID=A0A6A5SJB6_9PLEO|nr:cupin family protein [Clathrospora elynae]
MKMFAAILLAFSMLEVSASHPKSSSAQDVIAKLKLSPNPEKGYYRQTFEDPGTTINNRTYSTAIYYLLEGSAGASYWHRLLDAVEIWHYYSGAPMRLELSWNNGTATQSRILGGDIFRNQTPQVVIEKGQWQSATSLGNWTLVGTTVAPGFSENGYELPAPGWEPIDGNRG